MDYDEIEERSLFNVEQYLRRYCVDTDTVYKVHWKHIPSYYLDNDFKCYVN